VPPVFDGAVVAWGLAPTVKDVPGDLFDMLAYFEHGDTPVEHGDTPVVPPVTSKATDLRQLAF
jgi:hypothetical protein